MLVIKIKLVSVDSKQSFLFAEVIGWHRISIIIVMNSNN